MDDTVFRKTVMGYWRKHGRHELPWRHTSDPYAILVSEIMLQQTQVPRVIEKFREFLVAFPAFRTLARVSPVRVLKVWQGLGYNRRALMLQRCARAVVASHGGALPQDYEALQELPGIGPYTAGAIMAFAFNKPVPVIETNIRRIYLHHYFPNKKSVPDEKLLPIVARTLDTKNPRRWYGALMDYGTYLAEQLPNPNRRSKHYTRQAKFEGSERQLRGKVLRELLATTSMSLAKLRVVIADERLEIVVTKLKKEGFIRQKGTTLVCA